MSIIKKTNNLKMNMATANKLPCVLFGIPCWKVKDYCFPAHLFSLEIHFLWFHLCKNPSLTGHDSKKKTYESKTFITANVFYLIKDYLHPFPCWELRMTSTLEEKTKEKIHNDEYVIY